MINIIVVFPKKEIALRIKNILVKNGYGVSAVCLTGARVMQVAEQMDAAVIISGIRFADMLYYELKECLSDNFDMLVVGNRHQWEEYGGDDVIFLPLPMKGFDLVDTVADMLTDMNRRMKKNKGKPKIRSADDQGIINRAKMLLMESGSYTEEEAHRYLQKQSMDSGTNMVETAYMVLDMF